MQPVVSARTPVPAFPFSYLVSVCVLVCPFSSLAQTPCWVGTPSGHTLLSSSIGRRVPDGLDFYIIYMHIYKNLFAALFFSSWHFFINIYFPVPCYYVRKSRRLHFCLVTWLNPLGESEFCFTHLKQQE